jgi:hypothetical protein
MKGEPVADRDPDLLAAALIIRFNDLHSTRPERKHFSAVAKEPILAVGSKRAAGLWHHSRD